MRNQLVSFFALAFAWTWAWQIPLAMGLVPAGAVMAVLAMGAIGPSLAALIVAGRNGGVGQLFRAGGRVRPGWFVLALAIPPALGALAAAAALAAGASAPAAWIHAPMIGVVLLPPIGEELGWRGFAYPRLADRIGRLRGALVVGAAWALWHLPTAFFGGADLIGFIPYAVGVTAAGVWIAWLYERAGRTVWIAVVAHAAINAHLVALPDGNAARVAYACVHLGLAVACGASLARRPAALLDVTAQRGGEVEIQAQVA